MMLCHQTNQLIRFYHLCAPPFLNSNFLGYHEYTPLKVTCQDIIFHKSNFFVAFYVIYVNI
nr:MAG TPA: hypothetical protein [Caudoviricetes sp.]